MNKRNICVIGNSHIAAIKTGLDIFPSMRERCNFDFFAAHGDDLRNMGLKGNALVPTAEVTKRKMARFFEGKVEIETANYDGFILVGLGFDLVSAFAALQKYRIYEFHGNSDTGTYISRYCYAAMTESVLRNSTAIKLSGLLRSVSKELVVVIPSPYPSELIVNDDQGFWLQAVDSGLLPFASQLFEECAKKVVRDAGCEFLPQPSSTLASDPLTLQSFSRNTVALSPDMNVVRSPSDRYHMNALFGVELLKKCEELLFNKMGGAA